MARKPRAAKKQASTNGFDATVLNDIVHRFDELNDELASAKGVYMKRARDIADSKRGLIEEAKSRGIATKPLKAVLKEIDLSRKIAATRSELEADDADQAELMRSALGDFADLPLGAAAVTAADKRKEDENAFDSMGKDEG
ncbi:hypothetical protein [Microvirga brassicacearum]|uniref:Uncharacterized protein n=1 Tax=Microvirga brassicacearum TaxID=2580413 RepID=A0A5N3PH36_9HYPH|nr:hypothetical protein [Microvirga brassicacearum]KAB0269013.1 hypothetical protein FEZ63_02585 [Microvirga brassicacearum]